MAGWFPRWKAEHLARCYRGDFPEDPKVAEVFFDGWRARFVEWGMTYDVATQASIRVAEADLFANKHLHGLIKFATEVRKKMEKEHEATIYLDRDQAYAETPPWCECGRDGVVFRYRHESVREGRGTDAKGTRYACHCVCPMGQWSRQKLEPANLRLFVNLARFPMLQIGPVPWLQDGWDNKYCYHPDDWDDTHQRPIVQASDCWEMVSLLRTQGHQAVAERMRKEVPRPYVPRRPTYEPATYREATPEEVARAERWKQQHFPAASKPTEEAPAF